MLNHKIGNPWLVSTPEIGVLRNVLTHWNMFHFFHFLRNRPFIYCIDPLLQNLRFYDGPPVWDYKMYGRKTFCKGTGSTFHSVSFRGDNKTTNTSECADGSMSAWCGLSPWFQDLRWPCLGVGTSAAREGPQSMHPFALSASSELSPCQRSKNFSFLVFLSFLVCRPLGTIRNR